MSKDIIETCKKYNIFNYIINDDLTLDVLTIDFIDKRGIYLIKMNIRVFRHNFLIFL